MQTKFEIKLDDIEKIRKFLNIVTKFKSDIDIIRGRYTIDAKSSLGIFTIDLLKPVTVKIISNDKNEIEDFNKYMMEFM